MTPDQRRLGAALAFALGMFALFGLLAGCGGANTTTSDANGVPFSTPSRAEIARRADFALPASTSGFESVKVGAELHVAFGLAPSDVDAFESGSSLDVVEGRRVILHASPIWDLNPPGTISGAASRSGSIQRDVEVVVNGDVATVRIILRDA